MRTIVIITLLLAVILPARANLGDTEDQAKAQYGAPIKTYNPDDLSPNGTKMTYRTLVFKDNTYKYVVYFIDGKTAKILLGKIDDSKVSADEAAALLANNKSEGHQWVALSATPPVFTWGLDDASAFAVNDTTQHTFAVITKEFLAAEKAKTKPDTTEKTDAPAKSGGVTVSESGVYAYQAPDGWTVTNEDGSTHKKSGNSTAEMDVTIETNSEPLADYAKSMVDGMVKLGWQKGDLTAFDTSAGLKGFRVVVKTSAYDETVFYLFEPKQGTKLDVSGHTPVINKDEYEPLIDAAVKTLTAPPAENASEPVKSGPVSVSESGIYTYQAPEGWKVTPDGSGKKSGDDTASIEVVTQVDSGGLLDFAKRMTVVMTKTGSQKGEITPFETSAGLKGFHFMMEKNDNTEIVIYLFEPTPGTKLCVACYTPQANTAAYEPLFDTTIKTLTAP